MIGDFRPDGGALRYFGVYPAIVTDIVDPESLGRIEVKLPWLGEDGDTVRFGEVELQVAHCPGHTPGHIVFFHPDSRLAIVGDVLFQGSIGRTDFPRGNHAQLIDSIRGKLWPMGDDVAFVPGHGPMSTFGDERADNPFVADDRLPG